MPKRPVLPKASRATMAEMTTVTAMVSVAVTAVTVPSNPTSNCCTTRPPTPKSPPTRRGHGVPRPASGVAMFFPSSISPLLAANAAAAAPPANEMCGPKTTPKAMP